MSKRFLLVFSNEFYKIHVGQIAESPGGFEPKTPGLQDMHTNHLAGGISPWRSGQGARSLEYSRTVTATQVWVSLCRSRQFLRVRTSS